MLLIWFWWSCYTHCQHSFFEWNQFLASLPWFPGYFNELAICIPYLFCIPYLLCYHLTHVITGIQEVSITNSLRLFYTPNLKVGSTFSRIQSLFIIWKKESCYGCYLWNSWCHSWCHAWCEFWLFTMCNIFEYPGGLEVWAWMRLSI